MVNFVLCIFYYNEKYKKVKKNPIYNSILSRNQIPRNKSDKGMLNIHLEND